MKQIITLVRYFKAEKITKEDSFLDIGCGKGRVILFMHLFGFRKIDGIEYSNEISSVAKKNIDRLKIKRSKIYTIDAAEFNYYNEYNYIFMYNPFGEDIMEKVMKKLVADTEHDVKIIYYHPAYDGVLLRHGILFEKDLGKEVSVYIKKRIK